MATRDWEQSQTDDVLWAARKLVLAVAEGMDMVMDIIDPNQCERYGCDRNGEPLEHESDVYTTLDFLFMWEGMLRRANSALYEVSARLKEVGDGVPADLPDTEGR